MSRNLLASGELQQHDARRYLSGAINEEGDDSEKSGGVTSSDRFESAVSSLGIHYAQHSSLDTFNTAKDDNAEDGLNHISREIDARKSGA